MIKEKGWRGGSGAVRGYKVQQREGEVGGKGTRGWGGEARDSLDKIRK